MLLPICRERFLIMMSAAVDTYACSNNHLCPVAIENKCISHPAFMYSYFYVLTTFPDKESSPNIGVQSSPQRNFGYIQYTSNKHQAAGLGELVDLCTSSQSRLDRQNALLP